MQYRARMASPVKKILNLEDTESFSGMTPWTFCTGLRKALKWFLCPIELKK